jgi:hypothetical protein
MEHTRIRLEVLTVNNPQQAMPKVQIGHPPRELYIPAGGTTKQDRPVLASAQSAKVIDSIALNRYDGST